MYSKHFFKFQIWKKIAGKEKKRPFKKIVNKIGWLQWNERMSSWHGICRNWVLHNEKIEPILHLTLHSPNSSAITVTDSEITFTRNSTDEVAIVAKNVVINVNAYFSKKYAWYFGFSLKVPFPQSDKHIMNKIFHFRNFIFWNKGKKVSPNFFSKTI